MLFWNWGMDGYSEADEYGKWGRWDLVRKGDVFIEYEAEVSREWVVLSEELWILASFLLRPVSRNSVLEELNPFCENQHNH